MEKKKRGWIGPIVVGNRLFEKDPEAAYSSAWALSFYLMETKPYDYMSYMRKLRSLPAFKSYSQKDRMADFVNAFGELDRLEGAAQNFFARF